MLDHVDGQRGPHWLKTNAGFPENVSGIVAPRENKTTEALVGRPFLCNDLFELCWRRELCSNRAPADHERIETGFDPSSDFNIELRPQTDVDVGVDQLVGLNGLCMYSIKYVYKQRQLPPTRPRERI